MFVILLLLWIIFNGRLAIDVIVSGVLISAVIGWFAMRFCGWGGKKKWKWSRVLPCFLSHCVLLVKEIFFSNLAVMKLILSPKMEEKVHPQMVRFPVTLKTPFARMLLANSITLTPGTITVRLHPDTFVVHALTPDMGKDLDDCAFERSCDRLDAALRGEPAPVVEKEEVG